MIYSTVPTSVDLYLLLPTRITGNVDVIALLEHIEKGTYAEMGVHYLLA